MKKGRGGIYTSLETISTTVICNWRVFEEIMRDRLQ